MLIDDKLISYLEELSNLSLSAEEKKRLDLQKVIGGFTQFDELNTDGVPECVHPFDNVNIFRDDIVLPSFDRALILANAPVRNEEYFIAPKTVE